jgi:hypothetical protein
MAASQGIQVLKMEWQNETLVDWMPADVEDPSAAQGLLCWVCVESARGKMGSLTVFLESFRLAKVEACVSEVVYQAVADFHPR